MRCKKCEKIISENMKFCPYCGYNMNGNSKFTGMDKENEEAKKYYKKGEYNKLLYIALSGNIIAKGLYMQYIYSESDKSMLRNYEATLSSLIRESEDGEPFAMAAYGYFLYNISKKGVLFTSDTNGMDRGAGLVERAVKQNEEAALTIKSIWLMNGTECEKDEVTGYKYMKQAADMFYPPAMYHLGYWHCKGSHNITKNEKLGYSYIEKAAFYGNKYAQNMMTKNNKKWLDEDLDYSIDDRLLTEIKKLLSKENDIDNSEFIDSEESQVNSIISRCKSIDDYIPAYQKIMNMKFSNYDRQYILFWIEELVHEMTGMNSEIFETNTDVPKEMKKVMQIVNQYSNLEHFNFLFEDLEKVNLIYDDAMKKYILLSISNIIENNYQKELMEYKKYKDNLNLKGLLYKAVSRNHNAEMQQAKKSYQLICELSKYGYILHIPSSY